MIAAEAGQNYWLLSPFFFKGDLVNMYIRRKNKKKRTPHWKKIYFHTKARNNNKPIFLHLERDVDELQLCGFTVLCVHIITPS